MPLVPDTSPRKPTYARERAETKRELRSLHKKPPENINPSVIEREVVFSYYGGVLANDVSGGYMVRDPEALITGVYLTAKTAATADSTFAVRVNGTTMYTATWEKGNTIWAEEGMAVEVYEYDTISVLFPTVGSGLNTVVATIGYQIIAD